MISPLNGQLLSRVLRIDDILHNTLFLRYKPVAYGMKKVFKFPKKGLIKSNGLLKKYKQTRKILNSQWNLDSFLPY